MKFRAKIDTSAPEGGMYSKSTRCKFCPQQPKLSILEYQIYIGHIEDKSVYLKKEDHVCPSCKTTITKTKNFKEIQDLVHKKD